MVGDARNIIFIKIQFKFSKYILADPPVQIWYMEN